MKFPKSCEFGLEAAYPHLGAARGRLGGGSGAARGRLGGGSGTARGWLAAGSGVIAAIFGEKLPPDNKIDENAKKNSKIARILIFCPFSWEKLCDVIGMSLCRCA